MIYHYHNDHNDYDKSYNYKYILCYVNIIFVYENNIIVYDCYILLSIYVYISIFIVEIYILLGGKSIGLQK